MDLALLVDERNEVYEKSGYFQNRHQLINRGGGSNKAQQQGNSFVNSGVGSVSHAEGGNNDGAKFRYNKEEKERQPQLSNNCPSMSAMRRGGRSFALHVMRSTLPHMYAKTNC